MTEKIFVGKGWAFKFGVNIKINKAKLMELEPNQYGDIALCVVQRKEVDEKSKATHYVAVDDYKKDDSF